MSPSSQGGVTPAPAPAPRGWSLRLEVVCELVCHIPGPDPLQVQQCGTCQSGLDLHAAFGRALSEECRGKQIDMGLPWPMRREADWGTPRSQSTYAPRKSTPAARKAPNEPHMRGFISCTQGLGECCFPTWYPPG